MDEVGKRLAALAPPDADVQEVARPITAIVDTPKSERPFRTTTASASRTCSPHAPEVPVRP